MISALATRLQHAMHLLECSDRLGEILEGRAADQEVEGFVSERQVGSIAAAKIDLHSGVEGVRTSDLDKRFADVQAGDFILAEFCQFNGKITRTGRDFQNLGTWGNLLGDASCQRLEFLERFLGQAGVPSGDGTLHA